MNREEAIRIISESFFAQYKDLLISHLLPSVRIRLQIDATEIGGTSESWFGGFPCLPRGMAWPRWDRTELIKSEIESHESRATVGGLSRSIGAKLHKRLAAASRPAALEFVAQLSLREIQAVATLEHWPRDGWLVFFYDQGCCGYFPKERGGNLVLYFPEETKLFPVDPPGNLNEKSVLPRFPLTFNQEWTLPYCLEIGERTFYRTNPEYRLLNLELGIEIRQEPMHRFAGHPQSISDLAWECQFATSGYSFADYDLTREEREKLLTPGVSDWQLILQIDSDASLGTWWGDPGKIYFWARTQDIAAQHFAKTWLMMEID